MSVFRYLNRHLTVSLFATTPQARIVARAPHRSPNGPEALYCFWPAGASAAVGSGAGLSDLEFRKAIRSARSLPRGTPAKPIEVPGTKPFGFCRNAFRSSTVHLPGLPFIPAE